MTRLKNPNLDILVRTVERLGELSDEMVFLGGCATGLLITDKAAPPIRMTKDVDAIVHVASLVEYYKLSGKLRAVGFKEDASDGAPLCRWVVDDLILDVMPTDESILGFGNKWYQEAIQHAEPASIDENIQVNMVTAPYFLVTKLEAFEGRGRGDYLMSHDMEDIIAVLDGRDEIVDELKRVDTKLRGEIAQQFKKLLEDPRFIEAVSGHMPMDNVSQQRVGRIILIIEEISKLT
jgi:predicted nucleotidyltransferase